MCGLDLPGQAWNVADGQAMWPSTVGMRPGSLEDVRRRRPCPSTMAVPAIIALLFSTDLFAFCQPTIPQLPCVFVPFASIWWLSLCLLRLRRAQSLCSIRVSFSFAVHIPCLPMPFLSPSMSIACSMFEETCVWSTFRSHPLGNHKSTAWHSWRWHPG
jgi:hypothetical protein